MRIAMFTNTYLPLVGGASISIQRFSRELRRRGHEVLIIAPEYDDQDESEEGVLRVPALKNFHKTRFSVPLPMQLDLRHDLDRFAPTIIHTHHPFFLGDTALRTASARRLPIVVTHHTHYHQYTHYVPAELPWMRVYVQELSVGHANLCDAAIAPTDSVGEEMREAGVTAPIHVVPTGEDVDAYAKGDRQHWRKEYGIPEDARVLGHIGRLAKEKNLPLLAKAAARAMKNDSAMHALIVGDGPERETMAAEFERAGLGDRAHFTGILKGQDLVDAYHALDVFLFASKSETQGMVLTEALAAGKPLVVLDARGARDIVEHGVNGCLVGREEAQSLADAAAWVFERYEKLAQGARDTAQKYTIESTTGQLEAVYRQLPRTGAARDVMQQSDWANAAGRIRREWDIWSNRFESLRDALFHRDDCFIPSDRG